MTDIADKIAALGEPQNDAEAVELVALLIAGLAHEAMDAEAEDWPRIAERLHRLGAMTNGLAERMKADD